MFVIDVIPLSRTAPGVLSYRSKSDLPVGTIVSITVRRTATQGIVIDSAPVTAAKEMLKHARFLLSRSVPAPAGMLPGEVLRAAERTADYHATTTGAVLAAMFSEHVRAGIELPSSSFESGTGYERRTCEFPLGARAATYRKVIRTCISEGNGILLIAPTLPELSFWKDALKDFKPLVLSGALTGAKRAQALGQAVSNVGLTIVTPSFAWVPIEKLGAIIIDRISAGTYTLPKRPYLSIPYAVDALAQERGIPVLIGDFLVPLEYRHAHATLHRDEHPPIQVIDARSPESERSEDDVPWSAIPEQVMKALRTEIANDGRAIVLAARKGYAPAVVCRDCGQAQTDERGLAYSFSMAGGKRVFRTNDGHVINAQRACQRCGSWNLLPLGIGIERVEEEIRTALPETNIIAVPSELLSSPRKARTAVQESYRSGTVLIGTEALLPWLYAGHQPDAHMPLGIIASADSLLSQPFWRARERFIRLVYFLNGLSRETLLVTRHPDDTAVQAAADPSSHAFWKEEDSLRKALGYPPHGTIMTLTVEGSQAQSSLLAKEILTRLSDFPVTALPPRNVQGSLWRTVLVLTLPTGAWPDKELNTYIRSLPPSVRVRIDPESLW